ncbi:MAG: hypothetical protein ACJA13_000758 [Paraglaciecola sp.]|jgi:hypothetical protein
MAILLPVNPRITYSARANAYFSSFAAFAQTQIDKIKSKSKINTTLHITALRAVAGRLQAL